MRLTEIEYHDEEEPDWSHLPTLAEVNAVRPALAQAAQRVYDEWQQDEEGHDEMVGVGGICHLIADAMIEVLYARLPKLENAQTVSASHEVHVYIVAQLADGIYEVDIPHQCYECGGGYCWRKLPDVTFTPHDVIVSRFEANPGRYAEYVDSD